MNHPFVSHDGTAVVVGEVLVAREVAAAGEAFAETQLGQEAFALAKSAAQKIVPAGVRDYLDSEFANVSVNLSPQRRIGLGLGISEANRFKAEVAPSIFELKHVFDEGSGFAIGKDLIATVNHEWKGNWVIARSATGIEGTASLIEMRPDLDLRIYQMRNAARLTPLALSERVPILNSPVAAAGFPFKDTTKFAMPLTEKWTLSPGQFIGVARKEGENKFAFTKGTPLAGGLPSYIAWLRSWQGFSGGALLDAKKTVLGMLTNGMQAPLIHRGRQLLLHLSAFTPAPEIAQVIRSLG